MYVNRNQLDGVVPRGLVISNSLLLNVFLFDTGRLGVLFATIECIKVLRNYVI